jgi:hypothetical protein
MRRYGERLHKVIGQKRLLATGKPGTSIQIEFMVLEEIVLEDKS